MKRILLLFAFASLCVPAFGAVQIKKGSTDVTRYVMLVDSSTGQPETGYTITDLDFQYTRNRTAPAAKVDAVALAATDTAHTDGRAIQVDATSSPGLYRVDWPDAAFATGVDQVTLVVSGSGIHPAIEEIQLTDPEQLLSPINWGDFEASGQTINLPFSTPGLVTGGTLVIYEDGGTTEITDAETYTANFDTVASQNNVAVDLSNAAFEDGKSYVVRFSAGTLPDGRSLVGQEAGFFSVGRYASTSDINDQVVDAINVDTYSEPTGTPTATPTMREMIHWLYLNWRNGETVTASERTIKDDEGNEEVDFELTDNGTTFDKSEAAAAD